MGIQFDELDRRSIADQVAGHIRRQILNGALPPGARLPAERELAARFGTNRNTLREAVRMLVTDGLVSVRHGGGMEVLDYRRTGGVQLLAHFLREVEDRERWTACMTDALSLRKTAMALVAAMAAGNLDQEGARALRVAMEGIRAAAAGQGDPPAADVEFHRTLGAVSGSMVLCWAINTLVGVSESMVTDRSLWVVEPGYVDHMQAIADAILARDPAAAEAAVKAHFEASDAALAERLKTLLAGEGGG